MRKAFQDSFIAVVLAVGLTWLAYGTVAAMAWGGQSFGFSLHGDFLELIFFLVAGLGLLALARFLRGNVAEQLGLGPLRLDRITLLFIVATLGFQTLEALAFATGLFGNVSDLAPGPREIRVLGIINAVVMAPLVEEALFQGFLYNRVEQAAGRNGALVVSALAFAAFHGENGIGYVLAMVPAGFFLGYARMRSGNIALPIVLHAWMNGSIGLLALILFGWK